MDREVTAHRPDVIIKIKNEKTCVLIDMATPEDRNVPQNVADQGGKKQRFMYRDTTNVES